MTPQPHPERAFWRVALALALALVVPVACGGGGEGGAPADGSGPGPGVDARVTADAPADPPSGGPDTAPADVPPPPPDVPQPADLPPRRDERPADSPAPPRDIEMVGRGTIAGTVWAPGNAPGMVPEGQEIPVYGALVALTHALPAPFPQRAYCMECTWPEGRSAITDEDGRFEIRGAPAERYLLVIQKGQFRRVTEVTVVENTVTELPQSVTTLPSVTDPVRGTWIPKMAIATGDYDKLEDVLGKMGIGRVDATGVYDFGSAEGVIDVWDNGGGAGSYAIGTLGDLASDLQKLMQYHIVFIPCSSSLNTNVLREQGVLRNLRDYVKEGGKLYVTDWSGEWMDNVFPAQIDLGMVDTPATAYDPATDTWHTWEFGSADGAAYDSNNAEAVDEHLHAWLEGQEGPSPETGVQVAYDPDEFFVEGNWNTIEALTPVLLGRDADGEDVYDEPHAYVVGGSEYEPEPKYPLTVTFEPAGCGRVLFSTYHTTDTTHVGLVPQERVLIYLIMEIGVCTDPKYEYL